MPNDAARRVLLVDDHVAARRALTRLLELAGYRVDTAGDGRTAFDLLRDSPPFDAVITDMILPDIDGREVAKFASGLVPRPLTVLVTGWGNEQGDHDLELWQIDVLFLKPLDTKALIEALRERLKGPAS